MGDTGNRRSLSQIKSAHGGVEAHDYRGRCWETTTGACPGCHGKHSVTRVVRIYLEGAFRGKMYHVPCNREIETVEIDTST